MVWAWARSAATRATSREFSPARPNAGSTPFCVMSPRPTTAYPICFGIVLFLSRCFLQNNLQARGHATSLHTGSIAVGDKGYGAGTTAQDVVALPVATTISGPCDRIN